MSTKPIVVALVVVMLGIAALLLVKQRNRPAAPSYGEGGGYGRMAG
jgi:hypothetical protein